MGGDTRGGTELEVEEGESRLTGVRHCYRSIQGEQTFAGLTATNARALRAALKRYRALAFEGGSIHGLLLAK
jgi:hypothetical protein